MQRVTYPVMCNIQDEDSRLAIAYRKFLSLSAFIVFPLMCGLAALSFPLIDTVLGDEWHFAAVLLIPLCFQMMWYPIHSINLNLLQVKGRSDLFLRLEIIKKVIGVTILFVSLPFGLLVMCYTGILSSLICLAINTFYTGKLIKVGLLVQMKDIFGTFLLSMLMFVLIIGINTFIESDIVKLVVGVVVGVIFFTSLSIILNMKEVSYFKELIKK